MAVDRNTVTVGAELPVFVRTTGFHNWNRYAAVNDEFVPIHMDDEAGRASGQAGAFGMGNLRWSYLLNALRDTYRDDSPISTLASLISVGSANGLPRNWTANGMPSELKKPPGTMMVGRPV